MDRKPPPETPTDAATKFFAELDRLGEAEVQHLLDTGALAPEMVPFAREWLLRMVEDRARRQAGDEPAK
jgi:hypothetical protein